MGDFEWLGAISFEDARQCADIARLLEQASQYLKQGELRSALEAARSVLARGGEGFAPYAEEVITDTLDALASQSEEVEDWKNALQWREELVLREPSLLLPRLLLAEDFIMAENYHAAERELMQLLRRCPHSIEGWAWRARCAQRRADSLAQERTAQRTAVRQLIRFTRRGWQVLRKPVWLYYPSETVIRVTLEELYETTFAALAYSGRLDEARRVLAEAIAILGDRDNRLGSLRDSAVPSIQYHLDSTVLLSVIDHDVARRLLELSVQCDIITNVVRNGDYEQAFVLLDTLSADVDQFLGGWRAWRERGLLARAAEAAANAHDMQAEMRYIARWKRLSPSDEFPLFRWGELTSGRDHKEALRSFHRLLRRSEKWIEALIEVARLHYACRRFRLASRFAARAWQTLPSPHWCYYPSEAVVRDRLQKLFNLTGDLAAANGSLEQAEYVRRQGEALLREL
jgi:hypothetical protein